MLGNLDKCLREAFRGRKDVDDLVARAKIGYVNYRIMTEDKASEIIDYIYDILHTYDDRPVRTVGGHRTEKLYSILERCQPGIVAKMMRDSTEKGQEYRLWFLR